MKRLVHALPLVMVTLLAGCASAPPLPPPTLVARVDLPRFMGDWYVIASIGTFLEKDAHNARENYRLEPDGTVLTTFRFNAGSADGPVRQLQSRGFVLDPASNAVWGQQYLWPFKADYRISYLAPDYSQTVITRAKRDYVWIMARTPNLADADFERLRRFVQSQGYDAARLQRVPQDARPAP